MRVHLHAWFPLVNLATCHRIITVATCGCGAILVRRVETGVAADPAGCLRCAELRQGARPDEAEMEVVEP